MLFVSGVASIQFNSQICIYNFSLTKIINQQKSNHMLLLICKFLFFSFDKFFFSMNFTNLIRYIYFWWVFFGQSFIVDYFATVKKNMFDSNGILFFRLQWIEMNISLKRVVFFLNTKKWCRFSLFMLYKNEIYQIDVRYRTVLMK